MPSPDHHPVDLAYDPSAPALTPRIAAELIAHEGIVREAYRDSVGVWTWSVGITDASGHRVGRYRDNPQTIEHCLAVYLWALRERYLGPVLTAFGNHAPQEHELAAALSFHWNTGAIGRAEWMRLVRGGDRAGGRRAMLNWCRPAALAERRRREQALFFDGMWTGTGDAMVYDISRVTYRPRGGRRVPIMATLRDLMKSESLPDPAGADTSHPEPACPAPRDESVPDNWFGRLFRG